jgi:hypothetical protein
MAFNSAVAPYQFTYQQQTILRGCPVNDPMLQAPNGTFQVSVPLLTSVTRPDGSSFAPGGAGYLTAGGRSDPWLFGTATYAYAQENGVSELRSFCYDPNTGFLNRRRLYVQSATDPSAMSANDVVQQLIPDGGGNVSGELAFGGDNAPFPPSSSDLCQQTLPAAPEYRQNSFFVYGVKYLSQYVGTGIGFYTLNRGIDQATGLPTFSRDTANIQTNFTYEALGRLAYVLPRDGALTQYLYHAASGPSSLASLTVIQQQNGSPSTSLAQTRNSYDALGRLIEQDVQMPDGTWSARTTSYNALGWKTAVSGQGSPNTNLTRSRTCQSRLSCWCSRLRAWRHSSHWWTRLAVRSSSAAP